MKKILLTYLLIICSFWAYSQETDTRITTIKHQLELLSVENQGLTENLKTGTNVSNVTLSNFLLAISKIHKVNINVSPELQSITIVNNFTGVSVADLLVFLCKEYQLTIDFTGNILSIRRFSPPQETPKEKEIIVGYNPMSKSLSLDLKADPLAKVFRKIIDETGQNLFFSSGLENKLLTLYLKEMNIEKALETMAKTNGLTMSKTRDGVFLFNGIPNSNEQAGTTKASWLSGDQYNYKVLDTLTGLLQVNLKNIPVENVIKEIALDLDLDIYMATSLKDAGNITFRAKKIYFDMLLEKIFENSKASTATNNTSNQKNTDTNNRNNSRNSNTSRAQSSNNVTSTATHFTFKREGNIYYFGTSDQLSLRTIEVVPLMHRSIELLGDPAASAGNKRSQGRTTPSSVNFLGGGNGLQNNNSFGNQGGVNSTNSRRNLSTQSNNFGSYSNNAEALVNILPDEIKNDLDIKIDTELNSFLISGPAANINRFKKFVKEIDKPIPYVLIEVMLIEVNKSSTVETGISWGIGDEPTETKGTFFPNADATFGAKTINKVIGGFDGFGSFNLGQVVPNFFANIKALETNGNIKIRSTPKLSTLNGHTAHLSIGETTYYAVTNQNIFGSQNPQTQEIRNYHPIDAELAVSIRPLVSGDGQVTLDIHVIQSDFNGERIDKDAPPGLNSREFSSIIRMRNQDLAILGGLEERVKNDSGSGVPFLARIPIIKWFFSTKKRVDSNKKLTILIKPTVIY